MEIQELLPQARVWKRIAGEDFDGELVQTISACLLDLKSAGAKRLPLEDPLVQQAVKLYLKAFFGYEDKDGVFADAYEHLKAALALSGEYNQSPTVQPQEVKQWNG